MINCVFVEKVTLKLIKIYAKVKNSDIIYFKIKYIYNLLNTYGLFINLLIIKLFSFNKTIECDIHCSECAGI